MNTRELGLDVAIEDSLDLEPQRIKVGYLEGAQIISLALRRIDPVDNVSTCGVRKARHVGQELALLSV